MVKEHIEQYKERISELRDFVMDCKRRSDENTLENVVLDEIITRTNTLDAIIIWFEKRDDQLKEIIIKLVDILDCLDTKAEFYTHTGEESFDKFGKYVLEKSGMWRNYVRTDGYDLFLGDEKITNSDSDVMRYNTDC